MKRFFKIFLPLAPRVLLPQLLSAIVSQSFQGMELVGYIDKAGSQSPFDFSLLEGARPVLPLNL
ncbi:MAG: hypothetical protein J6W98_02320 [Bacteroidales bacterium]|nr:hypothetical protein [Bacteroidales bacterium]